MSNYNRYSNYPSTIDKLKQLPEYNDMTVEDKEKIGRYNELLTKNGLTSNEEGELRNIISQLRDKMVTSQDYNCVIGAIINQETFYKDGVLADVGNIVDVAERDVHDYCVYTKNDTKTFSDNKKGEMLRIRNDFNEWYRNLVQSLPTDKAMALLQQIRDLQSDTHNIDFKEVTIGDNVLATSDLFGGEIKIKKASGYTNKNISFGDGNTGGIKICTVNKNLFNPKKILKKSEDSIIIENIGTGYRVSSTTSTKENAYVQETVKGFINGETYNLSSNANIVHGNGIPKIQVKSDNQVVGEINGTGEKEISFVAKSNTVEVLIYVTPDCTGENVYEYENIMIEKGLYKSDYIEHREDTLVIPTVLRSFRGTQDELIGNKIIRRVDVSEVTDSNSWNLYNPPREEFYEESFTIHGYPDGCIYIDNDVKGNVTLQYAKTIATGVYVNSNEIQLLKDLLESKVGDIENIKQNQLEIIMQRDLQNQSTDMDCGYWFDSLKNMDKINVLIRANLNSNIVTNSDRGEIEWKEYEIGFKTNKATYYHNRKQSAITCIKENTNKGEVQINIQSAEITID